MASNSFVLRCRDLLDEMFPTIARYVGVMIIVSLSVATMIQGVGHIIDYSPGYLAGGALVGYKSVKKAVE